ncbi:hypothetical protein ABZ918_05655 [Streptomyces viridosporus]|uniref:hypothetical protein n=1 Tax=Streptomyces viridosporus TaxID=67581 RepID=UPI0034323332
MADAEVMSVVSGMLAEADSIDGVGVLRHDATAKVYRGVRTDAAFFSHKACCSPRRIGRAVAAVHAIEIA